MLVKVDKKTVVDTTGMSRDELLDLKDEVMEAVTSIKSQLAHARARAHNEGVYADPKWYASATEALARKQQTVQRLSREIGKRKREERSTGLSVEEAFLKEAKDLLATDTFEMLMDAAESRVENERASS